ncbi:MAG TPA: glycosyltransferase, partial [Chloroflexota bacterium]|nr:glycosyltransferase [Chloroflexota bacterium]
MPARRDRTGPVDSARLRILYTPPRYYPYVGGVEEHCRGYAREMRRRGHDVTICCADDGPPLTHVDGIPVRRCRTALKVANTNVTPGLPLHLLRAQPDIIHSFLPTPWSADWSALVGKARGIPVVLSYDNNIVGQGAASSIATAYNRLLLDLTLRAADAILVLNRWYAETCPQLAPFRHKLQIIPPGIDTSRFAPDDSPRWPATFFFLSILDEYHRYKGLDVLLRAMASVIHDVPTAKLIVGGSGPLQAEYTALARQLSLETNVEFRGYVSEAELLNLYRRCTAFVLPSTSADQEGFGIVAAEAMACGAPVIVSDIVGVTSYIRNPADGAVVPHATVPPLASALTSRCRFSTACSAGKRRDTVENDLSLAVIGNRLE